MAAALGAAALGRCAVRPQVARHLLPVPALLRVQHRVAALVVRQPAQVDLREFGDLFQEAEVAAVLLSVPIRLLSPVPPEHDQRQTLVCDKSFNIML